jgi:hypothetical protein
MAGFLAYALAGAASGAGEGMIAEARAKREAAMEELRNSRLMEREDRQFDRQGQLLDRQQGFQRERDQADRDFKLTTGGDRVQTDQGLKIMRPDGTMADPRNPDGTTFDGKIISSRDSSDPRYAIEAKRDMLIAAGWDEGRASEAAALGERPVGAVDRMKLVEDQLKTEYGKELMTNDRSRAEIRARRNELMSALDDVLGPLPRGRGEAEAPGTEPPGAGGARRELPAGYTREQVIEEAKAAVASGNKDPAAVSSRLRELGIDPSEAGL